MFDFTSSILSQSLNWPVLSARLFGTILLMKMPVTKSLDVLFSMSRVPPQMLIPSLSPSILSNSTTRFGPQNLLAEMNTG